MLVLEKTSADAAGGNSFYTAGAFRFTPDEPDSLREPAVPIRTRRANSSPGATTRRDGSLARASAGG